MDPEEVERRLREFGETLPLDAVFSEEEREALRRRLVENPTEATDGDPGADATELE